VEENEGVGMLKCKSATTPMTTTDRLDVGEFLSSDGFTEYRIIVGGLQYLTIT
jgi:hypothetical protein